MRRTASILYIIIGCTLFLMGCQGESSIHLDEEESYILTDNDRSTLTVYAMLKNEGDRSSNELYADFTIKDEQLADQLGSEKILFNTNEQGIPERFSIEEGGGYFISESFSVEEELEKTTIEDTFFINVYNEEEEKILEETIENIRENK
ncbi:hypothetical protein [Alteribacillus sp. YIM 98480]|uniref:hypothetical protein n=1 Tax=Alteribacillus sp. YIM 98480 TaxID=2606599 RepID=UPI00131E193F|nr:hypothetical protein [Alteribacillus sp. YIM 98480]